MPHNETGEGQGPAIGSVALVNAPFLDDMLPVAASRNDGSPPASGSAQEEKHMPSPNILQRAAAFFGRQFTSDEEVQQAPKKESPLFVARTTRSSPSRPVVEAVAERSRRDRPRKDAGEDPRSSKRRTTP
jgi:hypothetical protein